MTARVSERRDREEMKGRHRGVHPPCNFSAEVKRTPQASRNPGLKFRIDFEWGKPNPLDPKIPGTYRLTAYDGGVLYDFFGKGQPLQTLKAGERVLCRSLSAAAQAVTGGSTNGPLFWGLNTLQEVTTNKGVVPKFSKALLQALLAPLDMADVLTRPAPLTGPQKGSVKAPRAIVPQDMAACGNNDTSKWLKVHLRDGSLLSLCCARVAKKLQRSSSCGMVEDMVQNYFTKLIRRDGLKALLDAGKPIPYSLIASFAVRSAFTDVRDSGKDPIARESMGARTETERKKNRNLDTQTMQVPLDSRVIVERDENTGHTSIREISDGGESGATLEDGILLDQVWSKVRSVLYQSTGDFRQARKWASVLKARFQDATISEIASEQDIPEREVAQIISKAQTTLGPFLAQFQDELGL